MAIELKPYDPAKHLKSDEEIVVFLTDALESGHAGVIAGALGAAARAKGIVGLQALSQGEGARSHLSLDDLLALLNQLGLTLSVGPATAAAA